MQLGLSDAEVTFYTSWLYLPWVIKPLWSPFLDLVKTKRWWIVVMQLFLGAAFAGVAFTVNTSFWLQGSICFFWLLSFSSATHDVAADGFYMMGLNQHDQAFFVGIRSTFYRISMVVGKGGLIALAGLLHKIVGIQLSWALVFYGLMALFIGLSLYHRFILPRPSEDTDKVSVSKSQLLLKKGSIVNNNSFPTPFSTARSIDNSSLSALPASTYSKRRIGSFWDRVWYS